MSENFHPQNGGSSGNSIPTVITHSTSHGNPPQLVAPPQMQPALAPAVEDRLRYLIREEFTLFERNLISQFRFELQNTIQHLTQQVLPKVAFKDENTPIVNMKEHVDPLLNDLLHENKYPTMEEISDKLSGLTSRIAITQKQYKDWFEEKKSEVQDRMRHIRAYLGQKIREMFCEVYGLELDMSADLDKKKALLNLTTSYKNQAANWTSVLQKACKPKEPSPNTRAWAEVIIDAFLNNKTLRDMGENAVIRAYKEKLGQPLPSSSGSGVSATTPKKPKKRKKSSTGKELKKEDDDDDFSNPSLLEQMDPSLPPPPGQSVLQSIPTPTAHHNSMISFAHPTTNLSTFTLAQSYMLPMGTQPMNVTTTSNTTTVMGHKFIPPNSNMMETEEDGGTAEKRKVE
jgi:hypothetical protein